MHYKNRTPAVLGDIAKWVSEYEITAVPGGEKLVRTKVYIGILTNLSPGSVSCNGTLRSVICREETPGCGSASYPMSGEVSVTIGQCEKVV